jgi:hypothetical protein
LPQVIGHFILLECSLIITSVVNLFLRRVVDRIKIFYRTGTGTGIFLNAGILGILTLSQPVVAHFSVSTSPPVIIEVVESASKWDVFEDIRSTKVRLQFFFAQYINKLITLLTFLYQNCSM